MSSALQGVAVFYTVLNDSLHFHRTSSFDPTTLHRPHYILKFILKPATTSYSSSDPDNILRPRPRTRTLWHLSRLLTDALTFEQTFSTFSNPDALIWEQTFAITNKDALTLEQSFASGFVVVRKSLTLEQPSENLYEDETGCIRRLNSDAY